MSKHSEPVSLRAEPPEVVTHYYLAGRRPFLSLSELGDAELAAVLAGLRALRRAGQQHRPFGPGYICPIDRAPHAGIRSARGGVTIIDELGQMELFSRSFIDSLTSSLARPSLS